MKALLFVKYFALTAALVATTACAERASDRIVGKWSIDMAQTEQLEDIKSLPEDRRAEALAAVSAIAPTTSFEITRDKIITEVGGKRAEKPYTIKSETGYQVICESTVDGAVEQGTLTFQGDTLIMNQSNPRMTVALARK